MDETPAFPTQPYKQPNDDFCWGDSGMYLRDYFAAKALVVVYREGELMRINAERAYELADAMMRERCKPVKLSGGTP